MKLNSCTLVPSSTKTGDVNLAVPWYLPIHCLSGHRSISPQRSSRRPSGRWKRSRVFAIFVYRVARCSVLRTEVHGISQTAYGVEETREVQVQAGESVTIDVAGDVEPSSTSRDPERFGKHVALSLLLLLLLLYNAMCELAQVVRSYTFPSTTLQPAVHRTCILANSSKSRRITPADKWNSELIAGTWRNCLFDR